MSVHVSMHAIHRFIERVEACTIDEARQRIASHAHAIEAAADFDCPIVKLGDGSRLVLCGTSVLTVYAANNRPRQCKSPFRQEAGA